MSLFPTDGDEEEATRLITLAKRAQEQKQQKLRQKLPSGWLPIAFLQATEEEDQAIALCERALAIREQVSGPEHADLAATLDTLAYLYQDLAKGVLGRGLLALHHEIESRIRHLEFYNKALSPYPPEFLERLSALFRRYQEEYSKAFPLYQRAVAIRRDALGPNHPDVATGLTTLATFYEAYEAQGKTFQQMEQIFVTREQRLRERPREAIRFGPEREMDDAEEEVFPFYERALAILEQTQPDHPITGEIIEYIAFIHWDHGRHEESVSLTERAVALYEQTYGPDHLIVAGTVERLADEYYQDLGQHEHALALYRRVLTVYEREIPHDLDTADVMEVMADILDDLGQSAEADELRAREQAILDQQTR